tara:strand:- start:110 stop:709 length:600 start_codon:yes stop_codon:yes gene_type:complete
MLTINDINTKDKADKYAAAAQAAALASPEFMAKIPGHTTVTNATLNWAKLVTPTSPFGAPIYELQIATKDPAEADKWSKACLGTVKIDKDQNFTISLKRKAQRADGSDNGAPGVVDRMAKPMDPGSVGNGSTGNVQIYQLHYSNAGRTGISNSLTAVQVTNLEVYNSTPQFTALDDTPEIVDMAQANQEPAAKQIEIDF